MGNLHIGDMKEENGSLAGKTKLTWEKDMLLPAVIMKIQNYFLSFR